MPTGHTTPPASLDIAANHPNMKSLYAFVTLSVFLASAQAQSPVWGQCESFLCFLIMDVRLMPLELQVVEP